MSQQQDMTPGTQLHLSPAHALIEQVVPVENSEEIAFLKKPKRGTGLWTSTWIPEAQTSEWVEWCVGNHFSDPYTQQWLLLTPRADVCLYVVDSERDLHALLRQFSWRTQRLSTFDEYRFLDFERIAQEYDGIWLTRRGQAKTHVSIPDSLYGWDSESILWFRWCFAQVERIAPRYVTREASQ